MKRKDFLKTCLAIPAAVFGVKALPSEPPVFWGKGVPEMLADYQAVMNEATAEMVHNLAIPKKYFSTKPYESKIGPCNDTVKMFRKPGALL